MLAHRRGALIKSILIRGVKALSPSKLRGSSPPFLLVNLLALTVVVAANGQTQASVPELKADTPSIPIESRQYLLGNWDGLRSSLSDKGITFDFFYITDLQANPTGGLQQTKAGWERIRGTTDINFDRMVPWQGFSFHITGLWQVGANLGAKIGTLANPSDLVSAHTIRLDSFWFQQMLADNRVRFKVGQLAGLDFYGNQEYGGTWLMEPLGYAFGNLFSSVYESFNPAGTPGAELLVAPTHNYYVKAAIMSGNRDPYHQDPSGLDFRIRDTPNYLFETGFRVHDVLPTSGTASSKLYPGDYKFGGIYNGGKFSNSNGQESSGNFLIYGMASQALLRTDPGSDRGLDATLGFDWSSADVSRENFQLTAGARFNAPFRSRKQDRVAWALVYSKISDSFRDSGALLGGPLLGSEKAVEANYSLQLTKYYMLQPAFQYYVDVGGNSALSNAAVVGIRTKINF